MELLFGFRTKSKVERTGARIGHSHQVPETHNTVVKKKIAFLFILTRQFPFEHLWDRDLPVNDTQQTPFSIYIHTKPEFNKSTIAFDRFRDRLIPSVRPRFSIYSMCSSNCSPMPWEISRTRSFSSYRTRASPSNPFLGYTTR